MKFFRLIIFLLFITFYNSYGQGQKIELNEVEVGVNALPVITISGVNYSFKERDYFITRLLTEPFWSSNFKIKFDLSSFYEDRKYDFIIDGKTIVKIDDEILLKGHKFRSYKKIKKLLPKIKTVSIIQNNFTEVNINTVTNKNILLSKLKKKINKK